MAAEYQLMLDPNGEATIVRRVSDGTYIRIDIPEAGMHGGGMNRALRDFLAWKAEGNEPDPPLPPPRPEPPPLEIIRAADPENDHDVVTRQYLERRLHELEEEIVQGRSRIIPVAGTKD